jgi:polysaccharide pyruvyl transferase WcaK-like protein
MKYKKVGIDPAFFCAEFFLRNTSILKNKNAISINFREFPLDYTKQNSSLLGSKINDALKRFLTEICRIYNDKIITLIPMHYFYIGNDDRLFLNKIAMQIGVKNLRVQNVPLSLEETMETFANSYLCVGMRFHSILLQTLLNGNNYIFDYTEPGTGKINGFLNDLDKDDFYINRYISLHAIETDNNIESFIASFSNSSACFKLNENIFISKKQVFRDVLESIL